MCPAPLLLDVILPRLFLPPVEFLPTVNDLNGFNEIVTAEDVAQLRHEKPPASDPSDE